VDAWEAAPGYAEVVAKRTWSPLLVDGSIALVLLGFTLWEVTLPGRFHGPVAPNVLAMAGLTLPLILRRAHPLGVSLFMATILTLHSLAMTPGASAGAFVAWLLIVYTVASQLADRRRRLAIAALSLAFTLFLISDPGTTSIAAALPSILIVASAWAIGIGMRRHQERSEELQRRTIELEIEKDRETRAAAEQERGRIARELHDVIAHNLSTIVVQAGAARVRRELSAEDKDLALQAIEEAARSALSEVRALLGLVRTPDAASSFEPQPGLDDLDELCRKVTETGTRVSLSVDMKCGRVPEGVELSIYRIVQEGLTNVMKHAGASATAEVTVAINDTEAAISITDNGSTSPEMNGSVVGHGLVGIRERASLYGGLFTAGSTPDGGFTVKVVLPLPARAS